MPRFNVMIEAVARMYVEVEADSEEQAINLIENEEVEYDLDDLEVDIKSADVIEADLVEE